MIAMCSGTNMPVNGRSLISSTFSMSNPYTNKQSNFIISCVVCQHGILCDVYHSTKERISYHKRDGRNESD